MENKNIRNFVIISHIDHGKSTLADRFLEITGSVSKDKMRAQYLDSMSLEREKGITIKMHPCRMLWRSPRDGQEYILNMIDTPGHVDFSYEISRALACVEGAILIVDATKGVQAQTIFNLEQAQGQNLRIIGAVNKIDLPQAQVDQARQELAVILQIREDDILSISGREGINIEDLLEKLINNTPPPDVPVTSRNLRALIFDSKYDSFFGVIAYVRIFEGEISKNDKIYLMATDYSAEVKEVGYFLPELKESTILKPGEIGYIKTGIKEPLRVRVGDTITKVPDGLSTVEPLPGYKEPLSVLFLSLYPKDSDDFSRLRDALSKLSLSDPALDFKMEAQMALGRGFRVGFLGSLHAEITIRRLQAEFGLDLIATSPQVSFEIITNTQEKLVVSSPILWPDPCHVKEIYEPWVSLEIIVPNAYFNQIFKILQYFKIKIGGTRLLSAQKSFLEAEAPLRTIITGSFYDKLKSGTQGYASFNFKPVGFRLADLVKMDILIAGKKEEAFAKIVAREDIFEEGRKMVKKLKDALPPQQFAVAIQAAVSGKVIARETISALRKDVTAPLYGGDVTRKRKLLEIQKKGKKELQKRGQVNVPASVFLEVLRD